MTSYTKNPKGEVIEKRHVVRHSDGATATAFTVLEGPGTTPHREIVLLDGRRIYVNDSQAIRTTFYMKDQELAQLKSSLAKPASAETDSGNDVPGVWSGTDTRLGYATQVWRLDNKPNDGGTVSRMTSHHAPELGCVDLETTFEEVQPDGKVKLQWTLSAQSVSETELPEADLEISASCRKVPPSEFEKRTNKIDALADEASSSGPCATLKCGVIEEIQPTGIKTTWITERDSALRAAENE